MALYFNLVACRSMKSWERDMKKYIKATLLGGVLAMSAAVVSASADTIKIGFNVPLTGFAAADGQSALHGAELAVKQVNGSGGVNGKYVGVGGLRRSGKSKGIWTTRCEDDHQRQRCCRYIWQLFWCNSSRSYNFRREQGSIYLCLMPFILISLGPVIMFSEHPLWVKYKAEQVQNSSVKC